jgi:hypothetical protein
MAAIALVCERYFQMGATEMRAQATQTLRMSKAAGPKMLGEAFSLLRVFSDWSCDTCSHDLQGLCAFAGTDPCVLQKGIYDCHVYVS